MGCGLFGKLPAKRDFIAVNMPKELLLPWEVWMQGGISASKNDLANQWLPAYLQAPLWRFWLGSKVHGLAAKGVFMASMDGVGRHFPLTVFSCAAAGQEFSEPTGEDDAWYEAAEDYLLSTLDVGDNYDLVLSGLAALADAETSAIDEAESVVVARNGALVARVAEGGDLRSGLAALESERRRADRCARSLWWTIGGELHPSLVITANGMPEPHIMSLMVGGMAGPAEPVPAES